MRIIINGNAYPIPTDFTYRELGLFRRIAEVRPIDLEDALQGADGPTIVALGVIAARRAGVTIDADELLDSTAGDSIVLDLEGDEDRPTVAPETDGSGKPKKTPGKSGK